MKTTVPAIYIGLPDYQYFDSPFSKDINREVDSKYMERYEIEDQLRARLRDESNSRSGAILLTGYRGCGKTSLVRKVIKDMNHPKGFRERCGSLIGVGKGRILEAEINIAQDDIDERAILRLIAIELHRVLSHVRLLPFDLSNLFWRLFRFCSAAIIALQFAPWAKEVPAPIPSLLHFSQALPNGLIHRLINREIPEHAPLVISQTRVTQISVPGMEFPWFSLIDQVLLPILIGLMAFWLLTRIMNRVLPDSMGRSVSCLKDRLEFLVARMHSEVTTETGGGLGPTSTQGLFAFGMKRSRHYPTVKTKEVEQEIVEVLRVFGDIARPPFPVRWAVKYFGLKVKWGRRRIVFIVDELDKLIPHGTSGTNQKDNEDPTDDQSYVPGAHGVKGYENEWVRKRQEAIASLFANLKHFLNVAQAKFIFLGGRELYDATLADTSNRDAFFSSVFSQVLYVPSFLREVQQHEHGTNIGLTTTTERFVTEAILGKKYVKKHKGHGLSLRDFLQQRMEAMRIEVERKHGKDTGTAKAQFEIEREQLLFQYSALQNFIVYLTFRSNGIAKNLVRLFERSLVPLNEKAIGLLRENGDTIIHGAHGKGKQVMYLRLQPVQQHAHALLTFMYRPFLSVHSGFYRSLDDKQQVALTYLLDHLIKYHGIAFSFHQLESAPETIAVNKVPDFRKFLTEVLNRFTIQHLRIVDNGLFGFHFYNKIYHEIAYVSKVSDLDAAAMNFTLDESLPVKQYFYKRLQHLIKLDKEKGLQPHAGVLSPTADVHSWLGDLHFYDTEHEEALGQYRAAAKFYAPTVLQSSKDDNADTHWRYQFSEHLNEYIKLTLKQIHCLKKMKAMDDALLLATALSKNVLYAVRDLEKENSSFNWRLLALAVTCKPAIIAKTSRRPLTAEDLKDVVTFTEAISPSNTFERNYRLFATLNMYVGTIMHYANTTSLEWGIEPNPRFESAGTCYLNATMHLLGASELKDQPLAVITRTLNNADPERLQTSKMLVVANCVSKLADTYVVCSPPQERRELLKDFQLDDLPVGKYSLVQQSVHGETIAAILLAASAYEKASQHFSAVFQIKKLFFFMIEKGSTDFAQLRELSTEIKSLRTWARHAIHTYNQHMDGQQLGKFVSQTKRGFDVLMLRHHPKSVDVVSYETELFELDLLYYDLLLRMDPIKYRNEVGEFLSIHKYKTGLQFTRARHLMLCLRYNWAELPASISSQFNNETLSHVDLEKLLNPDLDKLSGLVEDSIFCAVELLAIMELMGPSYMNNHSLMAIANKYMADWCLIWESMFDTKPHTTEDSVNEKRHGLRLRGIKIRKKLARTLDGKIESRMDPIMYYTMALQHCSKATSVHSLGRSYRGFMGDMFFVEDDYMDNLYHFTCALERRRLLDHKQFVQILEKRIKTLRKGGKIWQCDELWNDEEEPVSKERLKHAVACSCSKCQSKQTKAEKLRYKQNWKLHEQPQQLER